MKRATVPKTAVDEHRDVSPTEDDVCTPPVLCDRCRINLVAEAGRMEQLAYLQLRLCVTPTIGDHGATRRDA